MTPYQEAVKLIHRRAGGTVAAQGGAPALVWVWLWPVATLWRDWAAAGYAPVRCAECGAEAGPVTAVCASYAGSGYEGN